MPPQTEEGSPGSAPSRSAESTEPQPQASLFPRPVGTSPSQCCAAGQGCATQLGLSVCVSTPALQHSCRDPRLSRRGEPLGPLTLHSPTWGLRKAEESRPALTPQPASPDSQRGLGSVLLHQPRQQGRWFLMRAAPSLEVHHPVEQRSHHPHIIHNLPILVIRHLLDVDVGPIEDV